jgi:hypothetical protein
MVEVRMRALLIVLAMVTVAGVARPAAALPEAYVGLGARTYGLPGTAGVRYAGSLEAGADAIYNDLGLGLRIDVPDLNPSFMAQFRYSVLKLPTVRLLAAGSLGVQKPPSGYEFSRAYELLLGARASLGLPYVGLDLGGANNWPDVKQFKLFAKLTVGFSF